MKTKTLQRNVLACLAATALATALAACGEESEQTLTFTLSGDGKASKLAAPASADSGPAEITLQNDGKSEGDLQLIRVEGDHSAQEVVQGLGQATKGQPLPSWFFAAGGTEVAQPGQSLTVTQVLEPGTYYGFDLRGNQKPDPKSLAAVEVSGEKADEKLNADATVSAVEYGFEADGLTPGKNEILFENNGAQPHHLLISELVGGATEKEIESFFKGGQGKSPLDEESTQTTAVIEGGESQVVTLDLKPGRYVFYCFVADRQGGPPHALKGMIDEVEVK